MRLSIITVNLNNVSGLIRTVTSVLSQTFGDYEFIIIDGASSDGSLEWIESNLGGYPFIRWISESDTGIFNAMNKGIALSSGEYLLFLNSGDFFVNANVLNKVFSNREEADIVLGRCRVSNKGELVFVTVPKERYTLYDFFKGSIAHQAAFIKRSLFDRLGFYQENLMFMGDWEFFLKAIILNNCSIHPIDIIVSDYNLDGVSSNCSHLDKMNEERMIAYRRLKLSNIIPDYERWNQWLSDHKALEWASTKRWIMFIVDSLYKIAVWRNKK